MSHCTNCGKEVQEKAAVCLGCGLAPTSENNYCYDCGVQLNPKQIVCIKCGVSVGSESRAVMRSGTQAVMGSGSRAVMGTDAGKKLPAALTGIFLGAFGVHKFILGYKQEGMILLLVTVCTLFMAIFITGPIGFIEGIIYLTKSDEEFVEIYIRNKKAWF